MGWPEQGASSSCAQAPEHSLQYEPHPYTQVFHVVTSTLMMGTKQVFKSLVYDPAIIQLKLSGSVMNLLVTQGFSD
jgi:hypothetical protein